MQAHRQIYEHAPTSIPIPAEFRNASIEVLFLRLNESVTLHKSTATSTKKQLKRILSSKPAQLKALSLDTTNFTFNREEANAR